MKLIRKTVITKDKQGQEKKYTNYFLELENGNYIAIKPAFLNDYKLLYVVSESRD